MIGAIIGDVIGSTYEFHPVKSVDFPLFTKWSKFTDDSVCTIAVANAILSDGDYLRHVKTFCQDYPNAGYGGMFRRWLGSTSMEAYNSYGNGSAMRVSPCGFAFDDEAAVLLESKRSAEITHNHPEGIKGAQAVALAIFLARNHADKITIKKEIEDRFAYDLDRHIDDFRPAYQFNETSQGSVPESIIAFLESNSYDEAVRLAISLGGDADTQACIAGGIAQAFFNDIPADMLTRTDELLDEDIRGTLTKFRERFGW